MKTQRELEKTRTAIGELKKFFVKVKKQWAKSKDRVVIGHVIWAPPISVATAPHSYTQDARQEVRAELQGERGWTWVRADPSR
jgi:hypothetical protein